MCAANANESVALELGCSVTSNHVDERQCSGLIDCPCHKMCQCNVLLVVR